MYLHKQDLTNLLRRSHRSGGQTDRTPGITIMRGKSITILEMDHRVVEFLPVCDSPWAGEYQNPEVCVSVGIFSCVCVGGCVRLCVCVCVCGSVLVRVCACM